MTISEFSDEFDVYAASQSETAAASEGLLFFDEYEKSVHLTKALNDFVKELYTGDTGNLSFEKTEELRRSLDALVFNCEISQDKITNSNEGFEKAWNTSQLNLQDAFADNKKDIWFITLEMCDIKDADGKTIYDVPVIPVTQDELHRTLKNPFRGVSTRRVLRMDLGNNKVQLLTPKTKDGKRYDVIKYRFRCLRKPNPIILVSLPDNLKIDGQKDKSGCELNSVTHRTILEIAVKMAIASRIQGQQQTK